jgi:hypothetical protein
MTRRAMLAGLGVTPLAGCLGGPESGGAATPTGTQTDDSISTPPPTDDATGTPTPTTNGGDSAAGGPPTADGVLPLPMEPSAIQGEAVSGGPPKDGIPSIDEPQFVAASDADSWLNPGDPVFGLARGDTVKAYPQKILVWHEICNDEVDGDPVSVTYCPLTGTAMGFERGETTFGVSGRLVNNNLIMYDRATETWWPQVLATAVPGPWNESPALESLREFRIVWTTLERWSGAHPETQVLSKETGLAKNYERDPYGNYNPRSGYYEDEESPMFSALSDDDRLPPKRVVIGARTLDGALAVEKGTLREAQLVEGSFGGESALAVYDPTLDTGYVYQNPDDSTFEYGDGTVTDESGESHAPADLPLDRVVAFDAMWFAWAGFYPDTELHA